MDKYIAFFISLILLYYGYDVAYNGTIHLIKSAGGTLHIDGIERILMSFIFTFTALYILYILIKNKIDKK